MKIIKSEDSLVVFDNGLELIGEGYHDCCAYNYLDFEQLKVGTELQDMDVEQFCASMILKEDGFSIKDIEGTPKWVQARSEQNGYYSGLTDLIIRMGTESKVFKNICGELN
jgi:hypothetical protein